MKTLEILKSRKDEIIEATLNILGQALSGDKGNRTFYFSINGDGSINVDYRYYQGLIALEDNCFYTIKDYETPDPEEFGFESIEEMDFAACGFDEQIENAIDEKIASLEDYESYK